MEKIRENYRDNRTERSVIREKATENYLLSTVIDAISDKKGEKIISLDLTHIEEAVADYFVICQANNPLQMRAICDHVEEMVKMECEERPYHVQLGDGWSLVDYINVVVHVFNVEERAFYDLEGLWLDGKKTEYTD